MAIVLVKKLEMPDKSSWLVPVVEENAFMFHYQVWGFLQIYDSFLPISENLF